MVIIIFQFLSIRFKLMPVISISFDSFCTEYKVAGFEIIFLSKAITICSMFIPILVLISVVF